MTGELTMALTKCLTTSYPKGKPLEPSLRYDDITPLSMLIPSKSYFNASTSFVISCDRLSNTHKLDTC